MAGGMVREQCCCSCMQHARRGAARACLARVAHHRQLGLALEDSRLHQHLGLEWSGRELLRRQAGRHPLQATAEGPATLAPQQGSALLRLCSAHRVQRLALKHKRLAAFKLDGRHGQAAASGKAGKWRRMRVKEASRQQGAAAPRLTPSPKQTRLSVFTPPVQMCRAGGASSPSTEANSSV